MDLVLFAKYRASCIGKSLQARNSSASTLFKTDNKGELKDKELFPDIESVEDIKSKFGAISFASELEDAFKKEKSGILDNDKTSIKNYLVNNTKWYFISYVINKLNQGATDFSNFNFAVSNINVKKCMEEYYDYLSTFFCPVNGDGDEDLKMDLTVFKTNDWYEKIEKQGNGFPELTYI